MATGTQVAVSATGTSIPLAESTGAVVVGTEGPTRTPTPFSAAQQTAVAQGANVPLVPYVDQDGRYTVSIPDGWTVNTAPNGFSATLAGKPVTAIVGIGCIPGATFDQVFSSDQKLQKQIGAGDLTRNSEHAITVDGNAARDIPWSGFFDLLKITIDHDWVYFEAKGCQWRIVLNTYPPAVLADYEPMFRRLLDSFKLK
jgi:hypothetical protein